MEMNAAKLFCRKKSSFVVANANVWKTKIKHGTVINYDIAYDFCVFQE